MKKILAFLYLFLAFALGTIHAQNLNAPSKVCLSPDTINRRWATISVGNPNGAYTDWTITLGTSNTGKVAVEGVDYRILYGDTDTSQGCNNCTTASQYNRTIVIEFLKDTTYKVRATQFNYSNRNGWSQTTTLAKNIVVEKCPIAVCKGQNSDMAGFKEDFGTTTTRIALDPARGQIQYIPNLTAGSDLQDNQYAISNEMQLKGDWTQSADHGGGTNGAMLVANSSIDKKSFYLRGVGKMCTGAIYNFTAWFKNANSKQTLESICAGGYIYAGVTFEILNGRDTTQLLAAYNTNDVSMPMQPNPSNRGWQQYGGSFKTPPGIDTVVVRIKNNNPGGCGNDIAVDDIEFTYCAPFIYAFFDGQTDQLGGQYTMCAGAATDLTSVINPKDYFTNRQYFWQYTRDTTKATGGWTTIAGDGDGVTGSADSILHFAPDALLLSGLPDKIDSVYFRLQVYERGNNTSCAQPSVPIKVRLLPNPKIKVDGARICLGQEAVLFPEGEYDEFGWRWSPALTDTTLTYPGDSLHVSPTTQTIYTVTGKKSYGNNESRVCYRKADAVVVVDDPPVLDLNLTSNNPICIGQSVTLSIDQSNADNFYDILWDPTGSTDVTLTHTPTTVGPNKYKVTVTNGACVDMDSVIVNVIDKPNVTLVAIPATCRTTGRFTIPFSAPVNSPNRYDVVAVGPNAMPGFTAVSNAVFPGASPITVNYPVTVAAGTYTFNLILRNTTLNSCETTKPFTVTVYEPLPTPTSLTGDFKDICVNGTVTLTVTGTLPAGAQWVWYTGSCGGTRVQTGGTTLASNISATTTFYVRAENAANPCPTGACLSYTANVYPMPGNVDAGPDQAHCEDSAFIMVANQPSSNTAKAVWSVISASVPVSQIIIQDVTKENTKIFVPKGATATINWGTPNGVCPGKDDQITLINYIKPSNLVNAGNDQKLCNVTSFNTTATALTTPTATGVWSIVYGTPTIANVNDPTTTVTVAVGDSVVLRWTVTNGPVCPPASDDVTFVSYRLPSAAVAGGDQKACNVTFFNMTATAPTAGTGRWTAIYGTPTIVSPTSATSRVNLTPGDSVVLRWTVSNGACTPSTDDVILVSYKTPTTAAAGPDQRKCNISSFTMAANAPAAGAGTGRWSVVYGSATITNLANRATTVTVAPGDSVVLRWTISNGNCTPSFDDVILINYEQPAIAAAGPDQRLCSVTSFTLAGNNPGAGTGSWTVVYGTPGLSIANPNSPTSAVTVAEGDSVVLRWTITNGVCVTTSDDVTLISYSTPTTATAGPDQKFCNVASFTMAGNTPAAGTGAGRWSVIYGNATINTPTSRASLVQVAVGDSVVLRWTISNGTCPPSFDDVILVNYEHPTPADAGEDQKACNVTSFTLAANAPTVGTGRWSIIYGTPVIANPNSPTSTVTVAPGDSVILRWTTTNGVCPSSTDDVTLVSYQQPTTAAAGPDQKFCNVASFTMAGNTPAAGTGAGRWSVIYGNATINTPTSRASLVQVAVGDSVVLRWTITNGTCPPSFDDVILVNYEHPTPAAAGPDQKLCGITSFTLAANAPSVGTGRWSIVYGTATIANLNNPTSTVTVAPGDSVILRWTTTNGVCPASTDDVTLISYVAPTTAAAGPDQRLCNVTSFTLAANTPVAGTGRWTVVYGTPGLSIADPNSPTSAVTVAAGDSVILRWTISNGGCAASTDDVTLVSYKTPTVATAGPDQKFCNVASFTMAGNTPAAGTGAGRWSVIYGNATINTPTSRASLVQVAVGDSVVLRWTISNGTCPPSFDDVILVNYEHPTPAAAGPDQKACNVTSFTLAANAPTVGTGRWSIIYGTPAIANLNSPTSTVTVAPGDSVVLRWTTSNGVCPSSTDDVTLVSYEMPTTAAAGPDQKLCNVTSFTLAANAPTVGTGRWTVVLGSATLNITNPTSPTSTVRVAAGDSVILRWTVTNGTCAPSTDDVTLVSYKTPTTAAAGPDQKLCGVTSFTLAGNTPAAGAGTGRWSVVFGTAAIANPASPTSTVTVAPGDSVVLRWTIANGTCTPSTDDVILVNYEMPTTAAAGPDQKLCNVTSFTLAANAPTVGTGRWTIVRGTPGLSIANPNSPVSTVTVAAGDSVILRWTVTNGACTPSTDDVTLVSYRMPTTAVAGNDQKQCSITTFTLAGNTPTVGAGRWSVIFGTATIATPTSPASKVTIAAGDSVVLRWTITNGNCAASTDDVVLVSYKPTTPATAGPDQKACNVTSFTLAANTPVVGTGRWTIVRGTPGLIIANPNSPTSAVTVAAGDSVILRWTISSGNCPPSSDDVTLVSYQLPSVANAGPDNKACNATIFTMAANTPAVGTGRWSIIQGSATLAITNVTSPTTTVRVAPGDSVVLRWTVSNGTCTPSTDNVTLVSYKQPTIAAAGPDRKGCDLSSITLAANTPVSGTGRWTIVYGTPVIANPASPVSTVTITPGDSVVLRWTITNGICPPSADDITLVSYRTPTVAAAGPDQKMCNVTTFTLAANTPVVGTGRWTVVRGSANLNLADPTSPTSTVTVAAGDSVILRWTITNGICPPSSDDVTLVSYQAPVAANAGADQQQCNNTTSFTLNANAPSIANAVGTWTIVSGTATITNIHDPKTTVKVAPGVTATLRWSISNGVCMATTDDVVITNVALVMGNTISADQTVCLNEIPAALTGGTLSGGTGTYTYQWQSSTVSATTGFINIATATNATYTPGMLAQDTWFRRIVTSGPCANNISNAVKITVVNKPPVVVFVPGALTVDCEMGKDYTTLFGTPQFSHTPYTNMPLTVTFTDARSINGCTQTFTRTWTATDKCGMSTTASQTITVVDRTAPVFTSAKPADVTVDCDKVPAAVTLTAMDNCMGALTVSPVETRQNIPGECANNYKLIRTWTATDGCSNSITLTQVITVKDMTAPVFTMAPPRDTLVNCNAVPAAMTLTATDNCTPGVINVTATDVRQAIPGSQCADNYQIIRTWVAMDACGNKATVKQTLTVQDTTRPAFSIPQPANVTVDCDKVPAWPVVTASDNCSANVKVVVGEQKLPTQPACPNNYRLVRTWTATDNCGNTASMQQIITVQDTTRPVFTVRPPADTTVDCDKVPPPPNNVVATDACSGNVKLSRSQVRETIPGACASNYRLIRTWIATDECGNQAIWRQVITVQDTTRPVIAPAPADITLTCGQVIPAPVSLPATDNCDASFPKQVSMVEDPYVKDVCAGYTIIRRWRVADACGNQANEVVQRITVMPCPKPELDPSLPMNCSDNPNFTLKLRNNVSNPTYTLVGIVPANAVRVPLTQSSPVFNLNNATQASFIVTDGITGCVSDTVTYSLQYNNKPMVNLGADTTICGGNSLILDAGAANFAYTIRWSTGETTQRINVSTEGTYWVSVTNGICTTTDTIRVGVVPMPLVNIPDASICRGQSVKLDAFVDGGNYLWSTGETTSSILVSTQEQFWVKVVKSGCITIDTVNVTVNPPPDFSLNRDTTICPDQSIMLTVNVTNGGTIRWATGATTSSIVVNEPGQYWVTISRDNCMVRDTVNVRLQPSITVDLGPDRQICPGSQISIDGTTQDALSYLWSDGDPNPVKVITATGEYRLDVMDRFCQRIFSDSVRVMLAGMPEINLGRDTVMCIGEVLRLRADGKNITRVLWSDGTTGPFIDVNRPGTYSVTVFNDCGSSTDQITVDYTQCDPEPHFPNAFSPDGNGVNDIFRPVVRGPMYEYELRIFNRWGELIYLGRDQKKGWDGRYQGQPVSIGTYVWWLTYKKMPGGNPNVIKGEVTVVK